MSDFQIGDRVTYHGDLKAWKGRSGRIRFVDRRAKFALVVPDTGLPQGFDVRMPLNDLHKERAKV